MATHHHNTAAAGSNIPSGDNHVKSASALGDLKTAAKGIHGVGETIRGTFNQAIDGAFHEKAGEEKHRAVADKGIEEMKALDARLDESVAPKKGSGVGNKV